LLVALGMFFEQYDMGLLTAALPQISRSLGIEAGDSGFYLGAIRLGGIGTVLLLPFADRIGRRRVFLLSLAGMSLGTVATAFSQSPFQFVAFQFFARIFLLTTSVLGVVILVEEFPAERRGAGLGLLAVLGGLGYGLSASLYAAIEWLPYGWRSLYAVGLLPVLLLPFLRRALPETRRFERERASGGVAAARGLRGWAAPVLDLVRANPRRAAVMGTASALAAMGGIAFFQYTSFFLQEVHGWAPGEYTLLVIGGGAIGVTGSVFGGRLSDRLGRRRVGFTALGLAPLCVALFYNGPAVLLVVAWGAAVFCMSAGDVVMRALSAELFATSHRSTSGGWFVLVQTLGWAAGLFVVGFGTEGLADLAHSITWVSAAAAGAALCLLALPETHRRELEAIGVEVRR
jgi:MFS family permease